MRRSWSSLSLVAFLSSVSMVRAAVEISDSITPIPAPTITPTSNPSLAPVPVPTTLPTIEPVSSSTPQPTPRATLPPSQGPTTVPAPVVKTSAPVPTPNNSAFFYLIFTPTNQIVTQLVDGDVIDVNQYGLFDDKFNVEAVPLLPNIDKVLFVENGRTESVEPYAFCGDDAAFFYACDEFNESQGVATVTAVLYDTQGAIAGSARVSFEIVNKGRRKL